MVNDSNMAKRRQHALDQAVYQQMQMSGSPYEAVQEPVQRPSRPVSWHPSSQMVPPHISMPQPVDFSQYMLPTLTPYSEADLYASYQHMPPTPVAYSGQTSPISTISPLSMPFASTSHMAAPPQYVTGDAWQVPAQFTPAACESGSPEIEPFPSYTGQSDYSWDSGLVEPVCHPSTTPPTPENYQPVTQNEPMVPAEESIPYQPLEDSEEEGEILIGMGLYDSPVKADTDPALDHYRTTTSSLLGTTYRKGAGLKLEEAWEPPKESDDEEDEEAEGDDDDDDE